MECKLTAVRQSNVWTHTLLLSSSNHVEMKVKRKENKDAKRREDRRGQVRKEIYKGNRDQKSRQGHDEVEKDRIKEKKQKKEATKQGQDQIIMKEYKRQSTVFTQQLFLSIVTFSIRSLKMLLSEV